MPRNSLLLLGGLAAVALFGLGWYLTSGPSAPPPAQNAVNPNAQIGVFGPFAAQGTMPDIGNLLSYNQAPGSVLSAPQATSVVSGVWDSSSPSGSV